MSFVVDAAVLLMFCDPPVCRRRAAIAAGLAFRADQIVAFRAELFYADEEGGVTTFTILFFGDAASAVSKDTDLLALSLSFPG